MKKYEIDYYSTIPSSNALDYDGYDIVDKTWMKATVSSDELTDNFDLFIEKGLLKNPPSKRDIIFFIKELKFYMIEDYQDAGDFYILNVFKYQIKK